MTRASQGASGGTIGSMMVTDLRAMFARLCEPFEQALAPGEHGDLLGNAPQEYESMAPTPSARSRTGARRSAGHYPDGMRVLATRAPSRPAIRQGQVCARARRRRRHRPPGRSELRRVPPQPNMRMGS